MRNKTRKLSKVKKYILPKLSGVDMFDIKRDKLQIFLNPKLHIQIEYQWSNEVNYHVWVNKIIQFKSVNNWDARTLSSCKCKNYPEIYAFIKSILMKDKDYVFNEKKN